MHAVIDWNGGTLFCPESGVKLVIPPSAIPIGQRQEVFVKVCKDNPDHVPLDAQKRETLLSPMVMCGPQGLKFEVPVELRLPQTGSNKNGVMTNQSGVLDDITSFVLKSGSGNTWKNIELLQPPTKNPQGFVSVMVNHF